jgi:hypothetical protein
MEGRWAHDVPSVTLRSIAPAAECRRPSERRSSVGEIIVLDQARDFPCRLIFGAPTLVLQADERGEVDDIVATPIARDKAGRIFTSTGHGSLTVWDARGKMLRSLGRAGNGPGEFAGTWAVAQIDPKGRVYVRDGGGRWSIFTADLQLVRTTAPVPMGYSPEFCVFLDDGRFLSATPSAVDPTPTRGRPEYSFTIYDFWSTKALAAGTPEIVKSFGPVPPSERGVALSQHERALSYAGGATFWVGPPSFVGRGYELEQWSVSGERLRVIRREVSWFPRGADIAPPARGEGGPRERPAAIGGIHADSSGLIYVVVAVPNPRWTQPSGRRTGAQMRQDREESQHAYIEVIDSRSGVVLASEGPMRPSRARAEFASGFFPRSRMSYLFGESPEGFPRVSLREFRLEAAR